MRDNKKPRNARLIAIPESPASAEAFRLQRRLHACIFGHASLEGDEIVEPAEIDAGVLRPALVGATRTVALEQRSRPWRV